MEKICIMCGFNSYINHIDVNLLERGNPIWRITCFYGFPFPERSRRKDSLDFLRSLDEVSPLPWCVFGDFNDLLCRSDKM